MIKFIEIKTLGSSYSSGNKLQMKEVHINPEQVYIIKPAEEMNKFFEESDPIPELKTKEFSILYFCNGTKIIVAGSPADTAGKLVR